MKDKVSALINQQEVHILNLGFAEREQHICDGSRIGHRKHLVFEEGCA